MYPPFTEQRRQLASEPAQPSDAFGPQRYGGIVLCGGRSRRMGCDKTWLRFGTETMLQRVVRLLARAVNDLVVVAGLDQQLPPLDGAVRLLRDRRPELGPLEGIAVGLAALAEAELHADGSHSSRQGTAGAAQRSDIGGSGAPVPIRLVFVAGCDMPLLRPALVQRMLEWAADCDLLIPTIDGRYEPLAAVYSVDVLPQIEKLLSAGRRRPIELLPLVRDRLLGEGYLRQADPQLRSFFNVNALADYHAALRWAGFAAEADQDSEAGGRR
jgi:molybdopterin-guanine dinucleotide biosynthesis protein A